MDFRHTQRVLQTWWTRRYRLIRGACAYARSTHSCDLILDWIGLCNRSWTGGQALSLARVLLPLFAGARLLASFCYLLCYRIQTALLSDPKVSLLNGFTRIAC